ncbi:MULTISPECIES: trimeric intracellular cation channel family protein [Helicobacter]|uniref:Predicted membrane protein n=2 Tax=Helicobacter TaxID=209 RepID=A0A377J704_9HELI|nr:MULTISPECIES: trimeric intracellular cation channel family protein [Helicobacter]MDL0080888.1 trimeric intracellular cation channel family protein [Helicobacter sp. CPD2-1]MDL0082922.1 trimeric intracellular cation channel family protein [Helicobacter sp. XJK30-2]STO97616.1 Predicted membrane protein [Helicobacter canis]
MFLLVLYIIGITAEGMSGALIAGRYKMDLIGVLFIALAAAIGGGSVRDILFNHYPLTWVAHPEYIIIVCAAALLTTLIPSVIARLEKLFLVLDALGLVTFAVIGAEIARAQGLGVVLVVTSGVITAVFGGVLRDIFCGIVPLVFRKEFYAGVAILTSLIYYGLSLLEWDLEVASIVAVVSGFIIRILAIWYNFSVPVFSYGAKE